MNKTVKMAPSPESILNYSSKQLPLVLTDKYTTVWNPKINCEIRPMRVISPPKQVANFLPCIFNVINSQML